jgi:hypothetical protein
MISNSDLLFLICIIGFLCIAFAILFFLHKPKKLFFIVFLLILFLALAFLSYYINTQINELKNSQNQTVTDLTIIDNYLLAISPWILLGDQNQIPITYPGIYN